MKILKFITIIFYIFPFISLAQAINFKGASHEINFPNAKIVLAHKPDDYSNRRCFFDTKMNAFFHWGGKPNTMQNIYFQNFSKNLNKGLEKPNYKNEIGHIVNPKYAPMRVSHSIRDDNGKLINSQKIRKFLLLDNESTVWEGISSNQTLREAVCFGEKMTIQNKFGGNLVFSSNLIKSWKNPYLAFQSCIKDSDNFEFENNNSDFSKYDNIPMDCWWD